MNAGDGTGHHWFDHQRRGQSDLYGDHLPGYRQRRLRRQQFEFPVDAGERYHQRHQSGASSLVGFYGWWLGWHPVQRNHRHQHERRDGIDMTGTVATLTFRRGKYLYRRHERGGGNPPIDRGDRLARGDGSEHRDPTATFLVNDTGTTGNVTRFNNTGLTLATAVHFALSRNGSVGECDDH